MGRHKVIPIQKKRKPAMDQIRVQFVIRDADGHGWHVTAAFGAGIGELLAMATENYRHVSAIIGANSQAAGLATGHPLVGLEALPLTDEQMDVLRKGGQVAIWEL